MELYGHLLRERNGPRFSFLRWTSANHLAKRGARGHLGRSGTQMSRQARGSVLFASGPVEMVCSR